MAAVNDPRISWDSYFLGLADAVSARADCTRRQVGAVIVGEDRRVVSTGYNGAPAGRPGCLSAGACPRGRHFKVAGLCKCGNQWPCDEAVPPGSSYDTGPGLCIATHAELNALLYAGQLTQGTTLYVSEAPCDGCKKIIEAAGVKRLVWYGGDIHYGEVRPSILNRVKVILGLR